ncbi:MAG TPA: 23S rRNA (guanosine(2251)-2'-O)-methyltransferase RlmB [Candidatus Acidoferrales bacterium]|nr:23S rRNA (guanosine(2251)-2'-O)-methyltransferase RlmB [Candidatus Acidoferrales bacterium]
MADEQERIHGFHAVEEALRAGESLRCLRVPRHREHDRRLAPLIALARERNLPVAFEREEKLRGGPGGQRHHDVSADIAAFSYTPWSEVRAMVRAAPTVLVVAVDHLEDPHNLGAVFRNAEGAGAAAVVMPERRNAGVTAVTRRASAGATSHLPISRVPNIAAALSALKEDGCWVTGLSPSESAESYDKADYTRKCVIVVGAEGKGLSRLVSERCDTLVKIPLRGKVASLNAASASAIVLFEVARRQT